MAAGPSRGPRGGQLDVEAMCHALTAVLDSALKKMQMFTSNLAGVLIVCVRKESDGGGVTGHVCVCTHSTEVQSTLLPTRSSACVR